MIRVSALTGLLAVCLGAIPSSALSYPAVQGADAQVISLCFDDSNVLPWRTREKTGLNFEMLKAVSAALGVQFSFHARPWRRCQDQLKKGEFDGSFGMSFTPERQTFAVYPPGAPSDTSLRMFEGGYVLMRRRGTAVNFDGQRVSGLTRPIGAESSMSIVADLRRQGYDVDDGAASSMALLLKLKAERIDAAAIGTDQMRDLMQREGSQLRQLEVLPTPLVTKPYFLVFSKQFVESHPHVAERIWKAIAEHRESPAYQAALRGTSNTQGP